MWHFQKCSPSNTIGIKMNVFASHSGAICFLFCWTLWVLKLHIIKMCDLEISVHFYFPISHICFSLKSPNPTKHWHGNIAPKTSLQYCEKKLFRTPYIFVCLYVLYTLNEFLPYSFHVACNTWLSHTATNLLLWN